MTCFVYPDDLDVTGADHAESRGIVDFPWKVIATDAAPGEMPRLELFNLIDDPFERRNRAADETARAARLQRVLFDFLRLQTAARLRFLDAYADGGAAGAQRRRTPSTDVLEQLKSLGYLK
jgi:hypothetical protein